MNPASLPEVGTATPRRLRDAAWSIVRHDGIGAATSRRITEAAGANLAAITYHFGSKDRLVAEAVIERLDDWTAPLTDALAEDADDIDAYDARIASAVASMLARFTADREEVEALVTLLVSTPDLPGVREAAARWLAQLRSLTIEVMTRQQAHGTVPQSVDPRALSGVFTAFALGLVTQSAIDPAAPDGASVVSEFLRLLVRPDGG